MNYDQGDPAELKHKFWEAMVDSPFVMLQLDSSAESAAPMTAQLDKDANHAIWFFTSRDNHFAPGGPATASCTKNRHAEPTGAATRAFSLRCTALITTNTTAFTASATSPGLIDVSVFDAPGNSDASVTP